MGYPPLVVENVSITTPPAPILLQQTAAAISQGGTINASGTYSLITQPADLTPLLAVPLAIASITWSGAIALVTTAAPLPGLSTGDKFLTTIAGAVPGGYNGTVAATVTGASTFTYALAVNPGTETTPGTYTPNNVVELQSMIATFFAQSSTQSFYVLELGAGDQTSGPLALDEWIALNPGIFYIYLVPRYWDSASSYLAVLEAFESPSSKTYFFTTTTIANYTNYTPQMKCVLLEVEAPSSVRPLTEYDMAATLQDVVSFNPSTSNLALPLGNRYQYGVTPYPIPGNGALFATLLAANVSFVGTAQEGGVTTAMLFGGKTKDGKPFSYWQSVDWIQLQADQALANAIINAANDPLAPIDYAQSGINFLQSVLVQTVQDGISFNLATGTVQTSALTGKALALALENGQFPDSCVVNAVPFVTYAIQNPANYAAGIYGGFSIIWQVNQFFAQILLNINATQLISQ